jgi:hypothetical protein
MWRRRAYSCRASGAVFLNLCETAAR